MRWKRGWRRWKPRHDGMISGPEEAGRVASSAIDALKGNPLCLALVVLVLLLQVIAYFRESQAQDDRLAMVLSLVERCQMPLKE